MSTDTNLQSLIINKMTKAQYQTITPDATQLYFITDDSGITSSDIEAALGFTPIEYKAGTNVTITNGTISATGTTYTAGSNISITNGTISATTTSTVAANSTVPLTSGGAYSSLVSGVVVDSTANKIKVTKAGTTTTITINDVGHATAADSATSATTATKLGSSNVGNTITPIYLSAGTPTALSYTIAKSVPSDAKFTDTTYSAGSNIQINGTTISATDTTYSAGSGITITNGTISATGTFPSQTGNAGKFLTTDGTVTSWDTVDAFVIVDYTA